VYGIRFIVIQLLCYIGYCLIVPINGSLTAQGHYVSL